MMNFMKTFRARCIFILNCIAVYCLIRHSKQKIMSAAEDKKNDTTYVLLWTRADSASFEKILNCVNEKNHCEFKNCFVTHKRTHLNAITDWDAILFDGTEFTTEETYQNYDIPQARSYYQNYVYVNIQPASMFPVVDIYYRFFNWTWTYRLDSRIIWSNIYIKDSNSSVIGPRSNMTWAQRVYYVSDETKHWAQLKNRAVALFGFHRTSGETNKIVKELNTHLSRYNLSVDIYTQLVKDELSEEDVEKKYCDMLREKYFFYLSLETHRDEDYVTSEFLTAMKNTVIPIVIEAPHYANFAPPGSYIELKNYSLVADKIYSAMNNMTEYYEYFWWTDLYRYDSQADDHRHSPLCSLCKALNTPEMAEKETVVENLEKWWNGYLL